MKRMACLNGVNMCFPSRKQRMVEDKGGKPPCLQGLDCDVQPAATAPYTASDCVFHVLTSWLPKRSVQSGLPLARTGMLYWAWIKAQMTQMCGKLIAQPHAATILTRQMPLGFPRRMHRASFMTWPLRTRWEASY